MALNTNARTYGTAAARRLRRGVSAITLTLAAVSAGGCGQPSAPAAAAKPAIEVPPVKAIASVHELMHGVVDPAARRVWGAVGTIITKEGVEERAPANDEQWDEVHESALALAEGGNLLLLEGRVKRETEWIQSVQALIAASLQAAEAAKARNTEALFASGEPIYAACARCHEKYPPTTVEGAVAQTPAATGQTPPKETR